jgi:hypothetical protein
MMRCVKLLLVLGAAVEGAAADIRATLLQCLVAVLLLPPIRCDRAEQVGSASADAA